MTLNLFSLSGVVLTTTCLILLFIILRSGRNRLQYIWGVFNVSLIIWGTSAFFIGRVDNELSALFWWKIAHIGIILIPVFFYHVIYLLCEIDHKNSLYFLYLQGVFFLALNIININGLFISQTRFVFQSFYYFKPGYLYHLFLAFWLAIVIHGIVMLYIAYRKSLGIRRNQIILFLAGLCIGFLGGVTNFFPVYGINIYPLGNFGIPLYCIVATYSIMRYRLMDIKLVFRKSMVYSLSAGILTSLFVVLVLTMTKFFSTVVHDSSFTITVVAALIIAVLFDPLKNKIQSYIDKNFYKRTFDYYPTIRKISRELTSIFDIDDLFKYVGNAILSTLDLKNIYLLHAMPGSGYEIVYSQLHKKYHNEQREKDSGENEKGKKIQIDSELVKFYRNSDDILVKDELPGLEKDLGQERVERIKSNLLPFRGEAVVPVFNDKKLVLLLILGEKLSGDMFTHDDINLLGNIMTIMGPFIGLE